jgi:hypothetical protein
MNPCITEVTPHTDHTLTLTFANGETRHFDLAPYLHLPCFEPLKQTAFFLLARCDHGTVAWPQFSGRSKVDKFDILFAMIGSIENPVIVETDLMFSFKNMAIFKYFSIDLSSPQYLRMLLSVVAADIKANAAGGVQSFVVLGTIRNQPIALPPLAEQHRIVAKGDELMVLCDKLEVEQKEADNLRTKLADSLIESALAA